MYFSDYLKKCREQYGFIQGDLAVELSHFDTDLFGSLDNVTLSRWELGKSIPSISRQVQVVKFFQSISDLVFPCFDESESEMIEKHVCKSALYNLSAKNRSIVLNFPSSITLDELSVHQLNDTEMIEELSKIALDLNKEFSHNHSLIDKDKFTEWTAFPSNQFLICEYNKQFFGLLFSLKLKSESFEKIMHFDMNLDDINSDDFADIDGTGSDLVLAFFAMNELAANLMMIRYFAHLIGEQKLITEVGAMSTSEEALKLMEGIHLNACDSKKLNSKLTRYSYRAPLTDVLINETVIRVLFAKEDCAG